MIMGRGRGSLYGSAAIIYFSSFPIRRLHHEKGPHEKRTRPFQEEIIVRKEEGPG
jgi:hypothetical protein